MAQCAGANAAAVSAVANDSIDEDTIVDNMKYTICGIITSPHFDRKAILQRSLKVKLPDSPSKKREISQWELEL